MNRLGKIAAATTLSAFLMTGVSWAQDHDDHHDDAHHQTYVKHDEWHKGAKIDHDTWQRGEVVDYKTYHLRRPPNGYEWREVDGNYVLAAVATGVIASAIIAAAH